MANEINIDLGKRRSLKANIGVPGYLGKGDTGTGIESITYKGEDESGGNMYTVLLTDGTSYDITAPKGAKGDKGDAGGKGADGAAGADGITPHIGDNGNWYLGYTDTGKPSRGETGPQGPKGDTGETGPQGPKGDTGATGPKGETGATGATGPKGDKGADGKSAYQYAQEGGYTGTETEFAEKLAQTQLVGTIGQLTPMQVYNAVSAGIPVKVQYFSDVYGILSFTSFTVMESMPAIASCSIGYSNGVYILAELFGSIDSGGWQFFSAVLAQKMDIPEKLPNPNALTFTGAVTGSYDGSAPLSVKIPSAVTDDHINSLIDTKLGVIENGSY